jgi:hypothetical protein
MVFRVEDDVDRKLLERKVAGELLHRIPHGVDDVSVAKEGVVRHRGIVGIPHHRQNQRKRVEVEPVGGDHLPRFGEGQMLRAWHMD